ncbi:rod shape-determining protein RodA [bacterium]|nr:rod shape-determining protein RodA [bacterium]MCI0603477.1 rod shape-determining protein RodA [bacterium]
MADTRIYRQFDPVMFFSMLSLIGMGVLMIYSATFQSASQDLYIRQLQWCAVALVLFFILLNIDYHVLADSSLPIYVGSLVFLVAVLFFGKRISGAKSWFSLGYFNFQPSEIAKIATILFLAKYLSDETRMFLVLRDFLLAGLIVLVPMFLIILQPDMGTTITFIPPLILLMFLAGMRYKWILGAILAGIASLPVFWLFLKPYQKDRILTFVDPSKDPLGAGYQIIQSKIAVGSGRIFGKGLFSKETQAYLDYIPEKHTDFVFSVLAEDFGLIGVVVTLAIYFILLMRVLSTARQARDRVGVFIVMGFFAIFFFHFVVNVGMIVGLMPITGLPLPLMSYGGSSLLSTIGAMAIIMNVRMRRFVN